MTTTEPDINDDYIRGYRSGYASAKAHYKRAIVRLRAEVNEQTIRAEKAEERGKL